MFALAIGLSGFSTPGTPSLKVGDPAPPVSFGAFLKGKPIGKLENGHMYLLDFWATWCTPCKLLMPHLSKVAERYKGKVDVLSVDVYERGPEDKPYSANLSKLKRFMKGAQNGMTFPVAMDDDRETMGRTWVEASAPGVPLGILIDGDGRVAWIGYPGDELGSIIRLALDGKLSADEIKASQARQDARIAENKSLRNQVSALEQAGEYTKAVSLVDRHLANVDKDSQDYPIWILTKYALLTHYDLPQSRQVASEYLKEEGDYPVYLFEFAFQFAEGMSFSGNKIAVDPVVAIEAAKALSKVADTHDPITLHALAGAYAAGHDYAAAAQCEEAALANLEEYGLKGQDRTFKSKLNDYRSRIKSS